MNISARYSAPDQFGIARAFEITSDTLDLIASGESHRKVVGDLIILFGEHETLGGWTASAPTTSTDWWTFACTAEPTPRNLIYFITAEPIPVASTDSDTNPEFQPGDTVRQHAPAMTVESVTNDEEVHCIWIEGAAWRRGTYPASSLTKTAGGDHVRFISQEESDNPSGVENT